MSAKHTLELTTNELRDNALGMEEAARSKLVVDAYLPAIAYFQFAARLWTSLGERRLAAEALRRAGDARCAFELEVAEQAQLDLEEG